MTKKIVHYYRARCSSIYFLDLPPGAPRRNGASVRPVAIPGRERHPVVVDQGVANAERTRGIYVVCAPSETCGANGHKIVPPGHNEPGQKTLPDNKLGNYGKGALPDFRLFRR